MKRLDIGTDKWQSPCLYETSKKTARISLPIHGNEDLKLGLLKHFMKIAGISEQDF